MKYFGLILSSLLLLTACGGESSNNQDSTKKANDAVVLEEPSCSYSYVPENTSLTWTAYKTNDTIPVGGAFDEVSVQGILEANSQLDLLKSVVFEINTASTNTNLPDRDAKIIKHFFGNLADSATIKGKVIGIEGDENSGTAEIELSMNALSQNINANYTINGNDIELATEIDVANWDASAAIAALNEVCYDLHKGSDGISKLWSKVSINIATTVKKNCD